MISGLCGRGRGGGGAAEGYGKGRRVLVHLKQGKSFFSENKFCPRRRVLVSMAAVEWGVAKGVEGTDLKLYEKNSCGRAPVDQVVL
jgi:hypothetical protein